MLSIFYSSLFIALLVTGEGIRDVNLTCSDFCENTYSPHTYEENGQHQTCKRGCRIMDMIYAATDGALDGALQQCKADCAHGYDKDTDQSVCGAGCQLQANIIREHPPPTEDPELPLLHAAAVSRLYDAMLQRVMQHMNMFASIMNQFSPDTAPEGSVVVYSMQSAPQGGVVVERHVFGISVEELPAQEGQDAQAAASSGGRRCPLSRPLRRFLLPLLLALLLVVLVSLTCGLQRRSRRASQRTPPPADDDEQCLLAAAGVDLKKVPLDQLDPAAVHGDVPPLPLKSDI